MAGFLQLDELRLDYEGLYVLFLTVAAFLMPMILVFPPVPPQRSDALLQTHSRAGLRPSESNLRDQFKSKFKSKSKSGAESAQGPKARVQSLHIYPVKSCRGIEVRQAKVLPTGLEFDRIYMFAQLRSQFPAPVEAASGDVTKDAHAWQFLTQRQFPRLATVKVDLWLPDEEKLRRQGLLGPGGAADEEAFLVLRFPWRDRGWRGVLQALGAKLAHRSPFAVPEREILLPTSCPPTEEIRAKGYEFEDVRIWRDTVAALNMEKELPEELRLYLGVSNRLGLFRVDPARLREVYRCAPKRVEAGYQPVTGFQDAYPLHIMNLSSVKEFSSHVPKDETLKELEVRRFRPNIIVTGAPAYDEETWTRVRLEPGTAPDPKLRGSSSSGSASFHVSCRTVRCKMPNVDQESGARHPAEPDKSLRSLRAVDAGAPRLGCLGMQMTPLYPGQEGAGGEERDLVSWVQVGMDVVVQERGEHVYIAQ